MDTIISTLKKITEFEKGLKKVKLSPATSLKVDISDTLNFTINGKPYQSGINHQMIHQLGNRIFQNIGNDYKTTKRLWDERIQDDKSDLADDIRNKLMNQKATLILDSQNSGLYWIKRIN